MQFCSVLLFNNRNTAPRMMRLQPVSLHFTFQSKQPGDHQQSTIIYEENMNAFEPYDERHEDYKKKGRMGVNMSTALSLTINDMKNETSNKL